MPNLTQIEKNFGNYTMNLFIQERELISIVKMNVQKTALNINISHSLICSLISEWEDSNGKKNIKYLVNRNKSSYFEEEVHPIENFNQIITLVCYKDSVKVGRILNQTNDSILLSLEFISMPLKPEETQIETIITLNNKEPETNSDGLNIFWIFFGGICFLILTICLVFCIKKYKKNNIKQHEPQVSDRTLRNTTESLEYLKSKKFDEKQVKNPYKNFER